MVNTTRAKAILVLVAMFALGALAGGAGVWAWTARQAASELEAGPAERLAGRPLRVLARELDLSPEQRAQLRELLERHHRERQEWLDRAGQGCGQKLREHQQRMFREMRQVLTPEQQRQLDLLLERHPGRFPPGPGWGGPRRKLQ